MSVHEVLSSDVQAILDGVRDMLLSHADEVHPCIGLAIVSVYVDHALRDFDDDERAYFTRNKAKITAAVVEPNERAQA